MVTTKKVSLKYTQKKMRRESQQFTTEREKERERKGKEGRSTKHKIRQLGRKCRMMKLRYKEQQQNRSLSLPLISLNINGLNSSIKILETRNLNFFL